MSRIYNCVDLFLILATTTTTTASNQTCTYPCTCAGITSYTSWQAFSTAGIYMVISTTSCNFNRTPIYFTSMAGTANHYGLTGYGAIYSPSSTSFTIYAKSLYSWNTSTLLSYASANVWNVNWFGLYY